MGWYITILQEMRDTLGLKGNELIVYAFIYGYSQGGHGCYHGSLATLQGVCGIASRQTAIDILKSLVEKGLIRKSEVTNNGVKVVSYSVCPEIGQGVQKMDRGCPEIGHNNNSEINKNINESMYKETRFNFKKSLLEIGVSEEVADAWLQVRKTKKATNTKIAFDKVHSEILKSGLSPDECIRKSVENSWSGFKADWLQNQRQERKVPPKERRERESVLEHNLKVMDEMFGTNMHQQAYNKKEVYDEQ